MRDPRRADRRPRRAGRARLLAGVRELFASRSVLLIFHRYSTVRAADRPRVLDGGRIGEAGSQAELMACGGSYGELFGGQASAYAG